MPALAQIPKGMPWCRGELIFMWLCNDFRTLNQVSSDFDHPFTVHIDALNTGLGVALSLEFEGEEHPVLFISWKLTTAEKNYNTVER